MENELKHPVYIWQRTDWPHFRWDAEVLLPAVEKVAEKYGTLSAHLALLDDEECNGAALNARMEELVSSAAIEGVVLNVSSVRSSLARRLGVELDEKIHTDHYVEGLVEVMLEATNGQKMGLTAERLCNWHAALFPTGRSGPYPITVGSFRQGKEPMVVVSGAMGREKVHYQALPSENVPQEIADMCQWMAETTMSPFLKSGLAHLWMVTIHPFDDGNGRLSRTVSDMVLAELSPSISRYISVSAEINREKRAYYEILERTQHGSLDVTAWLLWFLECISRALAHTEQALQTVLQKSLFWKRHAQVALGERQRKVLNRLWDGFFGNLTTSKYAKMCHCSQDTAARDINDLVANGMLLKSPEGGRSTHYILKKV